MRFKINFNSSFFWFHIKFPGTSINFCLASLQIDKTNRAARVCGIIREAVVAERAEGAARISQSDAVISNRRVADADIAALLGTHSA